MHKSTKVFDGFSTCFRQWRATHSHCSYLHGYDIDFKITFVGELDDKNWVMDFGMGKYLKLKSPKSGQEVTLKEWFNDCFDHTTVVALDDPNLVDFYNLARKGIIDLIVLPDVGAEKFAEYVFDHLNPIIAIETGGRVRIESVECREHGKNSAIYAPEYNVASNSIAKDLGIGYFAENDHSVELIQKGIEDFWRTHTQS